MEKSLWWSIASLLVRKDSVHHSIDGRASASIVNEIADVAEPWLLMAWALLLDLIEAALETSLSLLDLLQLCPQLLLRLACGILAGLELGDTVPEEVVDELHFRHPGLQCSVLGGQGVVWQGGFEVRAVDGRVGGRRSAVAESTERGRVEGVDIQRLLEHVLGSNVVGVQEVGRASARHGRL